MCPTFALRMTNICTYTDGSEGEDGGGAEEDVRKDPGHAERGEQGPGAHHLLQESTWPGTVSWSGVRRRFY